MKTRLGLGGSCHWCTEAIFASLDGVTEVTQGWLTTPDVPDKWFEGILLTADTDRLSMSDLIHIHLVTHSRSSQHALRARYLSAVYTFSDSQLIEASDIIDSLQREFDAPVLTQAVRFGAFTPSRETIQNYYYNNPEKPFCQLHINRHLQTLISQFGHTIDSEKRQIIEAQLSKRKRKE